ncbi:metal-sensing transcriptional repressor [Alkalilimnicola sp. S0819]|uniref:metal-sensing transcriptional repressor n=1 Tax=Alkalilimnicola sp. S0819 TaxID=2613922 RepID=UPI001261BC5D|nr:metal-sensing transcriptional repressor [Alkalilimnicola sp. S0819]KAB7628144.1 metal-sensing transcriptional repressor [Alkalilimnicola sp. S0819]MPQ15030.1 metal-sensing transcriptional repressor [Alkalilimnicola sp. S0819]
MASDMHALQQAQRKALLARLARVEGQIRGIRRMIEEDAACEQVAQQLAASRKALNKAFYEMMACAIEHEVAPGEELPTAAKDKLNELTRMLSKYG